MRVTDVSDAGHISGRETNLRPASRDPASTKRLAVRRKRLRRRGQHHPIARAGGEKQRRRLRRGRGSTDELRYATVTQVFSRFPNFGSAKTQRQPLQAVRQSEPMQYSKFSMKVRPGQVRLWCGARRNCGSEHLHVIAEDVAAWRRVANVLRNNVSLWYAAVHWNNLQKIHQRLACRV